MNGVPGEQEPRASRAGPPSSRARRRCAALQFYGHGLPTVLSGHLTWQYRRPQRLPQHFVLTVGYPTASLKRLCSSWTLLVRIDNRWHLDSQERGLPITACTLKHPLASDWNHLIVTDQL